MENYINQLEPKYTGSGVSEFICEACHCSCQINSSPSKQNGRHFADDIFKGIFMDWNISIQISLNFAPKGPIGNKSALVQVMDWCRTGGKPLLEPILVQFTDAYMRHYGEMS